MSLTFVSASFTPVFTKHSKSFSLLDSISIGMVRMQRNFDPMRKQVEAWRTCELTTVPGLSATAWADWL